MSENNSNRKRQKVKYYSKKELKELYPEGGFRVLGEVLKRSGKRKATRNTKHLNSHNKMLYKTVGYQWNEEKEGFLVVKKSNLSALILYGLLLVLIVVGVVFAINYRSNSLSVDPESAPFESTIKRPEEMDDSRILIPGYNDWNMLEGTSEVSVALFNPNENPCYFQFNVILDETGEVLYKTGLIPPGEAVTTVRFPRAFEKGTYPITLKIDSFSLEDETQKYNSGEVKTNIVVSEE